MAGMFKSPKPAAAPVQPDPVPIPTPEDSDQARKRAMAEEARKRQGRQSTVLSSDQTDRPYSRTTLG
jgi:hypothetical protein